MHDAQQVALAQFSDTAVKTVSAHINESTCYSLEGNITKMSATPTTIVCIGKDKFTGHEVSQR